MNQFTEMFELALWHENVNVVTSDEAVISPGNHQVIPTEDGDDQSQFFRVVVFTQIFENDAIER